METSLKLEDLPALQARAQAEGRECVVGALILDTRGRVFAQKRSAQRRLFPGCWDIAGGHVEEGESLVETLRREIREETGWELARIVSLLGVFDWEEQGVKKREFDFVVEVTGDLERPQIQWSKHSEYRWLGPADIEILKENRRPGDDLLYRIVKMGLAKA